MEGDASSRLRVRVLIVLPYLNCFLDGIGHVLFNPGVSFLAVAPRRGVTLNDRRELLSSAAVADVGKRVAALSRSLAVQTRKLYRRRVSSVVLFLPSCWAAAESG